MRALRWHGRRDVRLEDVPEAEANGIADSVVEVSLCGICGTDIGEFRAGPAMIRMGPHPLSGQEPPITLGHELVGVLRSGGSPDGSIAPGDRVTVDACLRCGKCAACLRGDYHMCRYGGSIGLHIDGGFAPLVAVPGDTLVAVPEVVTDEQAALTEPFAVGLHGLHRAGLQPADEVLVLGFGTIGAAAALVARGLGAKPYVVELDDARRAVAEELGIATLDPGDDLPRRVRKQIGDGGASVVIESTGVAAVTPVAIECAARGGRIALLGLPNDPAPIETRRLTLFERSLVGSLGYRHDLPRVLGMVASGALDPALVVSSTVGISESAEVLETLALAPDGRIKVLVDPRA